MCELTIKSTSGFSQISIQKKNNTHFDLQNHHTKIETDRETKKTPKETNEAVPKLNSEKSSKFISFLTGWHKSLTENCRGNCSGENSEVLKVGQFKTLLLQLVDPYIHKLHSTLTQLNLSNIQPNHSIRPK